MAETQVMRSVLLTAWFATWLGFQLAGPSSAAAAELASPTELKQVIDLTLKGTAPAQCDPSPSPSPNPLKTCIDEFQMFETDGVIRSLYEVLRSQVQSMISAGLVLPPEMDLDEAVALRFYTGNGYEELNSALRRGPPDSERAKPCKDSINSALAALPPEQDRMVYRGVNLPAEILASHATGEIVRYEAFTSTSTSEPFAGNTQIVIRSRSGHNIKAYSNVPDEDEVLFGAPSCFKVIEHFVSNHLNAKTPATEPWKSLDLSKLKKKWTNLILMEEVPCKK